MRRRLLIVLLALGTLGGYGSAIAGWRYRHHGPRAWGHHCGGDAAQTQAADPQEDR